MKLTFLGTSAGEEYPGIWCECDNCARARELGGKNIRRNSCVMIDDDLMIDMGKTAHVQADRFGKNIRAVKTLLVTHSHGDHLSVHTLWARHARFGSGGFDGEQKPEAPPSLPLTLFGSRRIKEALSGDAHKVVLEKGEITFVEVEP